MKLLVSSGPEAGRIISVDRELVLGRVGGQADVTFDDGQVSSRHAAVRPAAGGIEVEDLGSTNGTFVGQVRLSAPRVLADGDRLRIGGVELQAQVEGASVPASGAGTVIQGGGTVMRTAGTVVGGERAPLTVEAVSGPGAPASASLPGDGRLAIGRTTGDLVLGADSSVSSRHAEIARDAAAVTVTDLGSSNGTYVDGQRIAAATPITDASDIRVGDTVLRVMGAGAASGTSRVTSAVRAGAAPVATRPSAGSRGRTPLIAGAAAVAVLAVGGIAFALTRGGDDADPVATTSAAPATSAAASSEAATSAAATTDAATSAAASTEAATSEAATTEAATTEEAATTSAVSTTPLSAEEVIDRARKATVYILADGTVNLASGSGSVIDKENGYIITNNHVAGDAEELSVRTDEMKRPVKAKLIAALPCEDLALIQIIDPDDRTQFEQVPLGDSTALKAGEKVYAIGFPGAADNAVDFTAANISITDGIVSKPETIVDVPQSDVAPLQSVIQHTAAVNGGNSGGPLFNEFGEQIGINSAGGGGEDLNYSITTDRMLSLVDKMKEGYSPAWIGANFEVVLNDQGQPLGLQISNLAPFGPADRANMLPGQVIVGVNRRNTVTFKQFCRNMPAEPGTRVRLSVFDPGSGKVVAISLRPGTRR